LASKIDKMTVEGGEGHPSEGGDDDDDDDVSSSLSQRSDDDDDDEEEEGEEGEEGDEGGYEESEGEEEEEPSSEVESEAESETTSDADDNLYRLPTGAHLVTQTRNNIAAYGCFFDITASPEGEGVTITGIRAGSHALVKTPVDLKIFMSRGGSEGKEEDASAWEEIGNAVNFNGLPRLWEFEPHLAEIERYGSLPLSSDFNIAPGETVGICLHTSNFYGIVLRALKQKEGEEGGKERITGREVTDKDAQISLHSGRVLSVPLDQGFKRFDETWGDFYAFAGGIDYVRHARPGHAKTGES